MCGITGFTHWDRVVHGGAIRRATTALRHRGPDQQDVYVSSHISLGAVRLKVIDLNGGDQPLVSRDGSVVVVFNGEIYNHQELRRELEALGHRFQSRSDTEVVLEAFREWDSECFHKFRGMFAVAIWSEYQERLILARDRIGIKPLYFYQLHSDLYFGSELKALLEFSEIPRELDTQALDDFLSLNYVPGPRTLVRGITKLSPGCFLEHRRGKSRIERYWELRFSPRASMDVEDASEELDSLLRAAVREQLVSDVPSGIWLSGGLDSSTILHYASEAGARCPKTFSIAFESSSCDERRYFREMANRYGTDHCEYELRADSDLPAAIEGMAFSSDEPGADAGALPVWFLSKMSAREVTVALSGEGGDELFGGYTTYLADRIAGRLRKVPRALRTSALRAANRLLPVSDQKISFEYKLKRLLEGSLLPPDDSHLFWNGTFSRRQKTDLLLESANTRPLSEYLTRLATHGEIGILNRYLLLDQQTYLPDNILYKVDRMSMAHSLEVRPAFLDERIVEFAACIPEKLKIRGWTTKFILRHTMRGKLPATVLKRGKKGFDIPTHEWLRGVLKPLLLETLSSDVVTKTGLFDNQAIQMMVDNHLDRKLNLGYHLWGLMVLFLWLKRWKIEIPPAAEVSQELPVAVYGT